MRLPIEQAVKVAKENLTDICTVQEWAEIMGYAKPKQFSKIFRKHYRERPSKILAAIKIKKVEKLLNNGTETKHFFIAQEIGLSDEQALYKFIKYHTGHSPTFYKQ